MRGFSSENRSIARGAVHGCASESRPAKRWEVRASPLRITLVQDGSERSLPSPAERRFGASTARHGRRSCARDAALHRDSGGERSLDARSRSAGACRVSEPRRTTRGPDAHAPLAAQSGRWCVGGRLRATDRSRARGDVACSAHDAVHGGRRGATASHAVARRPATSTIPCVPPGSARVRSPTVRRRGASATHSGRGANPPGLRPRARCGVQCRAPSVTGGRRTEVHQVSRATRAPVMPPATARRRLPL